MGKTQSEHTHLQPWYQTPFAGELWGVSHTRGTCSRAKDAAGGCRATPCSESKGNVLPGHICPLSEG